MSGSTGYSIFTFKKEDEWENKAKKLFFPKHFTNKFVEHGRRYEKEALEAFKKECEDEIVTPGLVVSTTFPWLGFSPDGVVFENDTPTTLLEIKCPFIGNSYQFLFCWINS